MMPFDEGSRRLGFSGALRERAEELEEKIAFRFLLDGEERDASLTYKELDRRARAIGARLQDSLKRGERALLLYPPGIDYIAAFMGCLYAGVAAVPAYPPRKNRSLDRLQRIAQDAQASAALTSREIADRVESQLEQWPQLDSLLWTTIEGSQSQADAESWKPLSMADEDMAFLQYTSGSTAAPKGVMVSHGNLIHNEEMIQESFGVRQESVIVGWLPLYHDMGLIGNVLQTLHSGAQAVLMSPFSFLQRPYRWLKAISRFRASISGGPNFAYELCLRRIPQELSESLDLSCWTVAFNGAEPVRPDTLDRFAHAFQASGFRRTAFLPCYGLAEASLLVSGKGQRSGPSTLSLDASALERGVVSQESKESSSSRRVAASGPVASGLRCEIVDPISRSSCTAQEVGEIWLAGPSVASGYWNSPQSSQETFEAYTADGHGPYLRSGDLGFLQDGQLFVTGRIKDLIIVRGRNHYPQDIELTAERSHPDLRPGCGAAFSVEVEGEESLVLVHELERRRTDHEAVCESIRSAIAEEHELGVSSILLLSRGKLPKTSSGKIQRSAAKRGFLEATLQELFRWGDGASRPEVRSDSKPEAAEEPGGSDADSIVAWLRQRMAVRLGVEASRIDPAKPAINHGLDSLGAFELAHEIEERFGAGVPMEEFFSGASLQRMAEQALQTRDRRNKAAAAASGNPETSGSHALTVGQQSLYFLNQLDPSSAAYNISNAVRLLGPLDAQALQASLTLLSRRHPALRTVFEIQDGAPLQREVDDLLPEFAIEDATGCSSENLQARLVEESRRPFDLARGPLLRARLFRSAADDQVLLISIHHVIADFWSLSLMARELEQCYAALKAGGRPELPPAATTPAKEASRQREWLASSDGRRAEAFWTQRLSGWTSPLDLPCDRPRPPVQSDRGRSTSLRLEKRLSGRLQHLARSSGVTLNALLTAAFELLLGRYSGQSKFLLGTLSAGRPSARTSDLVGYLVNPLPLRARLGAESRFQDLMQGVQAELSEALAYQDFPFASMVERLQPQRDPSRSPLFQVLFTFQRTPSFAHKALAALAIGEGGAEAAFDDLKLQAVPLDQEIAQFDLTLRMAETESGLVASMQFNADLFEQATVVRMLESLRGILEAACEGPKRSLASIGELSSEDRLRLLSWNETAVPYPTDATLDILIANQAQRTPDAPAVVFQDESLTYSRLDRLSNRLARVLRRRGAGPEAVVGICIERSLEMMVGLTAILKAGAAYVPIDPEYPGERIAYMIEDAGLSLILSLKRHESALQAGADGRELILLDSEDEEIASQCDSPLGSVALADNAAYVIYTSGSTGRPKGAINSHRAICNRLLWMSEEFGLQTSDRVLQKTPLSFDVSVWELFLPLISGAVLEVARPGGHRDANYLVELIRRKRVSVMHFVPPMLEAFLQEPALEACTSLRQVVCSGEALPLELAQRFFARLPSCALANLYGPTEAAVDVSCWHCSPGDDRLPIGRPVANTQLHVLDSRLRPMPVGAAGELYIGGVQVGRSYRGRPALSAERFIPDPFTRPESRGGDRLYRTGDLVRWLQDGTLEFLGRNDYQVKVRGFRIELGEIESALISHPQVRSSVVVAHQESQGGPKAGNYRVQEEQTSDGAFDADGFRLFLKGTMPAPRTSEEKRLVAYLVCEGAGPSVGELRRFLQESLPDYMIPSAFLHLESLPLLPNGKVNRKELPQPDRLRPRLEGEYAPPSTDAEKRLASIWEQVLAVEPVGVEDNYFELGGDSIRSIRIRSLAQSQGIEFSLQQLFQHQTVRELALAAKIAAGPSASSLTRPLSLITSEERALLPDEVEDAYPLSRVQAGLVFHSQHHPDSPIYHVIFIYRLRARYDLESFRQAARRVTARHPILRSVFELTRASQPLQLVLRQWEPVVEEVDLRHLSGADLKQAERDWIETEKGNRFDWRKPLIRFYLLRTGEDEFQVVLSKHDAILDGWSAASMLTELFADYSSLIGGEELPALQLGQVTYRDFVALERATIEDGQQLEFWDRKLEGSEFASIPRMPGRPQRDSAVGAFDVPISHETSDGLKRLAQSAGVPLKNVLLAAHLRALSFITGQCDLLTGLETNGRLEESDAERSLGVYINNSPLRRSLSGGTWVQLSQQAFEGETELLPYRRYPLFDLQKQRHRRTLFEAIFNYTYFHVYHELAGLRNLDILGARGFEETSFTFRAEFNQNPFTGLVQLDLLCDLKEFDRQELERFGGYYAEIFREMARNPLGRYEQHSPLSASERRRIVEEWNDTAVEWGAERCLHQHIEEQVRRTPHARAIVFRGRSWSYRKLNGKANALARYLRRQGVGLDSLVAVCMERSLELPLALLAILKAGAAYAPLDCEAPGDRLEFMLNDLGRPFLLTQSHLLDKLPEDCRLLSLDRDSALLEQESDSDPENLSRGDSLAYVIYTSGSTGRPKGAMVAHQAICNRLLWMQAAYGLGSGDRVLQKTPYTFDVSVWEFFWPLMTGASMILAEPGGHRDCGYMAELIQREGVTTIHFVPSVLKLMAQEPELAHCRSLKRIICSGEALGLDLTQRVLDELKQVELHNLYGPTEAAVDVTSWACRREEPLQSVPIGGPISNVRLYVLDREGNPAPVGTPGELFIGGIGLGRGYLGRPGLSAERFVPDPFSSRPGRRLYRTGDRARWLPQGVIDFLGRLDFQVKINGQRIEPGEIESALALHPQVRECAVAARTNSGATRLVAYLTAQGDYRLDRDELRRFLGDRLPRYMVPAAFVQLDAMPLNSSGKLDRKSLPEHDLAQSDQDDLDAILDQLEEMSEEEAASLLSQLS